MSFDSSDWIFAVIQLIPQEEQENMIATIARLSHELPSPEVWLTT